MADNNFHLTYGDLSNFTYGELSNFRYCDLTLDKLRLVDEIQKQNIIVPDEVRGKIFNLCDAANISYPTNEKSTLDKITHVLKIICSNAKFVIENCDNIQSILDWINKQLS